MKEFDQSVIELPQNLNPKVILKEIEKETERKWNEGWYFVKAEPDALGESLRLFFERKFYV